MMADNSKWSIIIHGGARTIKHDEEDASRKAATEALECGVGILKKGGSALDAVEASIQAMEIGGVFNAGRRSVHRSDTEMHMDASIMDGRTLAIGAVAGLQGIKHPISVARVLMTEPPILLYGRYAMDYALANGFKTETEKPAASSTGETCDTVGCVAMDKDGNIACGLSTGGLASRMPGAIGDVPLPGCGFYADNTRGGLCFSGDGESISRVTLASEILHRLEKMPPEDAIEDGLALLDKVGGEAGCILIDREGNLAWSHRSDHYAVAFQTSITESFVSLKKSRSGSA
jgi:beta-aspartyl-peptidase (threonine type)